MTIRSDDPVGVIAAMTAPQIISEWARVHDVPAPAIAPSLLARDLAHRAQVTAAGGVDKRLERRLLALVADDDGTGRASRRLALGHGTQLLREWGGQTHRVTIEPGGRYLYAGRHWTSLSAIARAITGARWSGPRFFGTSS